jgi:hypothetical protein
MEEVFNALSSNRNGLEDPMALLRAGDRIVQCGVLIRMFESQGAQAYPNIENGLKLARYSQKLKHTLSEFLYEIGDFNSLENLALAQGHQEIDDGYLAKHYATYRYRGDSAGTVKVCNRLFLLSGNSNHLTKAHSLAKFHSEDRLLITDTLSRLLLIYPENTETYLSTHLHYLYRAGCIERFKDFASLCLRHFHTPWLEFFCDILQASLNEDPALVVRIYRQSGYRKLYRASAVEHIVATAYKKLGQHKRSAISTRRQHRINGRTAPDRNAFLLLMETVASFDMPRLTEAGGRSSTIFLGFPRTGTTLLETMLSTHPDVYSWEEPGYFAKALNLNFFRGSNEPVETDVNEIDLENFRNDYNKLVFHRRDAARSKVVIDKSPIESAAAKLLWHAFPEKNFLFSIRHPYDVILSNFQQNYSMNIAMASFQSIVSAVDLYDFAMGQWFYWFGFANKQVHYVRYDNLVENSAAETQKIWSFLGLKKHDAALFPEKVAEQRYPHTPSYANVRKGLNLGVQSYYQNYLFLFDDYCRSKLDPWVEFFGYTVEEPRHD